MSISFANGCEQRTTADGNRLSFYDVGSGQLPVVMLHGLFGSPSNWQSIMHDLADHYRFLALQLPIEPGKDRRHTSFDSLSQLTEHVIQFFDEMGLGPGGTLRQFARWPGGARSSTCIIRSGWSD